MGGRKKGSVSYFSGNKPLLFIPVDEINGTTVYSLAMSVVGEDGVDLLSKIPDEEGVWDYRAGASGSVTIPDGGRVLGIAVCTIQAGATVVIDGGDAIPIPWVDGTVQGVEIAPRANLVAPTIVFSGTAGYVVEFVT